MALTIKIKTYEKRLSGRLEKLFKGLGQDAHNTVLFGSNFAKLIAPKDTGSLALAIRPVFTAKGGAVVSGQPNDGRGRPYHLWWHNRGRYALSNTAARRGWQLTGRASVVPGVPANMYMKAVAVTMRLRLQAALKSRSQQLRVG